MLSHRRRREIGLECAGARARGGGHRRAGAGGSLGGGGDGGAMHSKGGRMRAVRRVLGFCVVALCLALLPVAAGAKTVTITVSGVTYSLTSSPQSYVANAALLQSQPWWGNEPLAFA